MQAQTWRIQEVNQEEHGPMWPARHERPPERGRICSRDLSLNERARTSLLNRQPVSSEEVNRDQRHFQRLLGGVDHRCAQKIQTDTRSTLCHNPCHRLIFVQKEGEEELPTPDWSFHTTHCCQVWRNLSTRYQGFLDGQRELVHKTNGSLDGKGYLDGN